jgi:hypothetical protein
MHAVCGTGLEYTGTNFTVDRSMFLLNGDHFGRTSSSDAHSWSDGLTLDSGPGAVITNNLFQDGSDINFIVGGGMGARIAGNTVRMVANGCFGGFMLDNFNSNPNSNFVGALVTNNTILCGGRCHFGVELGPHPWYESTNIFGGTVTGNTISGAAVCLNLGGAGAAGSPFVVYGNALSGAQSGVDFLCGKSYSSLYNIAPDSVVDRRGDTAPVTSDNIIGCP